MVVVGPMKLFWVVFFVRFDISVIILQFHYLLEVYDKIYIGSLMSKILFSLKIG